MPVRQLMFVALFCSVLLGQTPASPSDAGNQNSQSEVGVPSQATGQPPSPQPGDDWAQMRTDLDRMESLNTNMSSEIEFLRDQNLQILLRTNAQMWTMLIRDLRRQIDRDQQNRLTQPPAPKAGKPQAVPR